MGAIFRREFKSCFTSPIGYVQIAIIVFFACYSFFGSNIAGGIADMSYVFSGVFLFCMLALPITTMRLFSEDKRQKTDQLLLTSPISLTSIVLGKFLAAYAVLASAMSVFVGLALLVAFQTTPEWAVIIGNILGLLLVGGMVIGMGMLISSLTESQVIAALGSLGLVFLLLLFDNLSAILPQWAWLTAVINFMSTTQRYDHFVTGIIQYNDIIFFITMQALFVFLTVRVLDSRRWS